MEELSGFRELGLSERTIKALWKKGFSEPTEIQKLCIPLLLKENTEVIGQAQTGTGKTAAFALPIIETLEGSSPDVEALVLCPTRELAMQVANEIESLKGEKNIRIAAIYGGASMPLQIKKLKSGLDVVVGTPGRILDHLRRGTLDLSHLKFSVLDEADEMLDMGFIEDIEGILEKTPEEKRMLMFSATMPEMVLRIAKKFMHEYTLVRTEIKDTSSKNTHQSFYVVKEGDKLEALSRLIDIQEAFYGVVFCRTKVQCEEIAEALLKRGYNASSLHGDLSQRERESILKKMKEKYISILVATDVAARGLDIRELTHVINYSIPEDPEVYIHRVGRTGRAGKEGSAITLVTPREMRRFSRMMKETSSKIEEKDIPSAEEVVAAKKNHIIEKLSLIASGTPDEKFIDLAAEISEESDPLTVLASLLENSYGKMLDEKEYKTISSRSGKRSKDGIKAQDEKKGKEGRKERKDGGREKLVRLFIARGKKDGMSRKLVRDILVEETGVTDADLDGIEVMDDFSFVNAKERASERILRYYKKVTPKNPIVVRAKEDGKARDERRERGNDKKRRRR